MKTNAQLWNQVNQAGDMFSEKHTTEYAHVSHASSKSETIVQLGQEDN